MQTAATWLFMIMVATVFTNASDAFAIVGQSVESQVRWQSNAKKEISQHPWQHRALRNFHHDQDSATRSFRLGRHSLQELTSRLLRTQGLHPRIRMEMNPRSQGLNLTNQRESQVVNFYVGEFRLCEYQVHAHGLARQETLISGSLPMLSYAHPPSIDDFGRLRLAINSFLTQGPYQTKTNLSVAVIRSEPCLLVDGDHLIPVWEVTAEIDELPYFFWANQKQLYHSEPRYFSALGRTRVFNRNANESEISYVTMGNLIGDGTLTSKTFEVQVRGHRKARSCTHEFYFEPDSIEFAEASALTHATLMLDWYQQNFGFELADSERMQIKIREQIQGDINNALYVPADSNSSGKPQIIIGEGDGKLLQNLMTDADVISHEFGHHVVYRSVKTVSGASLVIHEALADFFTFARTGDPCLGGSICPPGSPICWVDEKCLRTADNDLKFGSANLPNPAHLQGQFISGMLWDIYVDHDVKLSDLSALVYHAIDFLSARTSFSELMVALVTADAEFFDGKYCSAIVASAENRGLSGQVSEIECDESKSAQLADSDDGDDAALPSELVLAITNESDETGELALTDICHTIVTRSKGELEWWNCGTLGASNQFSWSQRLILMLLLSFPLLFIFTQHSFSKSNN